MFFLIPFSFTAQQTSKFCSENCDRDTCVSWQICHPTQSPSSTRILVDWRYSQHIEITTDCSGLSPRSTPSETSDRRIADPLRATLYCHSGNTCISNPSDRWVESYSRQLQSQLWWMPGDACTMVSTRGTHRLFVCAEAARGLRTASSSTCMIIPDSANV